MKNIFALLVVFASISANAADYTAGTGCPVAVNHQPLPNLEYKAGESASGYAVAPAEDVLPILTADDFAEVPLPLDIPVGEYLQQDRYNLQGEQMELRPGQVVINAKTGDALFNGKSILSAEPTIMDPDCWK